MAPGCRSLRGGVAGHGIAQHADAVDFDLDHVHVLDLDLDREVDREVRTERSVFDSYSRDTLATHIWGAAPVQTLHFVLKFDRIDIPVQIDYVRGTGHPSGRNNDEWQREEFLTLRSPAPQAPPERHATTTR